MVRYEKKELIDQELLQKLQNRFSRANQMYLLCMDYKKNVLTSFEGTSEEEAYLKQKFDLENHRPFIEKLVHHHVENVIEEPMDNQALKMCGVAIEAENDTQVIWIAMACIQEKLEAGADELNTIMLTTEERFYRSIELLEAISKQLFSVKVSEKLAQEAFERSYKSEQEKEEQLRKSQTMATVVKLLASDEPFADIALEMIEIICKYLHIAGGCLLGENMNGKTIDVICEYQNHARGGFVEENTQEANESRETGVELNGIAKETVPFFSGKPYMISSDSTMPEVFQTFMDAHEFTAAMFLPIETTDRVDMYLCFFQREEERYWSVDEIKMVNDVKYILQSVLTRRIAKNSLASSYASLKAILEHMGCGIYVMEPRNRQLLYTNETVKRIIENSQSFEELEQLLFPKEADLNKEWIEEIHLSADEHWYDVHKTLIEWVDGRKVILCTLYDITDKKRYQQKMEKQVNNDFLTGLYNRMRCEKDLSTYVEQAIRAEDEGALLLIDLDDFKHINDGLGLQYGDALLKMISQGLQSIPGIEDTCYRMGGDEFIIIVPSINKNPLEGVCEDIKHLFAQPWKLKENDYYCTMSMGITKFPTDAREVKDIIQKADSALFVAKHNGKNRINFFDETLEGTSFKRLDIEKNMRDATMNACKEFEVYFQPIIDVARPGNPCCGAEALLRWNSKNMGMVSPADFIPLAEYLGLINPIGDYVLMEATKQCKYWNDMGHPDYKINVNLSVVQLLQNDIVEHIQMVLEETRLNPQNLTLEVTESLAINDMNRMRSILGQIRELGVRVALDDFGTGYSSLNHIRELPIDVIKIDRCFIENLQDDSFSDAFVKLVSGLADTIGMTVCVEGVENEKQYQALQDMRIRLIQGFYFDRPLPKAEFEAKYVN